MTSTSDVKRLLSARDLVHSRTSGSDSWNLALVQRDEKWDAVRMRHLLDSMLANYPIGAILLCRVEDHSDVIERVDGVRVVRPARPGEWQLVDGQQRINAFYSMLTEDGKYGRFFLHMTMHREPPGPVQARRTKDRRLPYIVWRDNRSIDEVVDRALHIDLSRWDVWASAREGLLSTTTNVAEILHDLDPEFTERLTPDSAQVASDRLNALWRAWVEPSIPALYSLVQSPADVLEIFTRVNLGGVDVVSSDVFFAAVKTYWSDAETRLDAMRDFSTPFLADRMRALRFASRVASRAITSNDLLPLGVDRLAGPKPHPLIVTLDEVTQADSTVSQRLTAFSSWFRANSKLGYALHWVASDLFDDVLAWAVTSHRSDDTHYAESGEAIDSYLLGATLFRYPATMRDTYRRMAFLEAMTAGSSGDGFQVALDRILAVARAGTGLRGGISTVDTFEVARRRQVGRYGDGPLLTSLAQHLPLEQLDMDWDHMFPQAEAQRMWARGQSGRRVHHPDRELVNSTGNFWALDSGANRALQETTGRAKFDLLRRWAAEGVPYPVHPFEQWSFTEEEIEAHIKVDVLLDGTEENIEKAMVEFRAVVETRALRLWDSAIERFPQVRRFAADHDMHADDPSPATPFYAALKLTPPVEAVARERSEGTHHSDWVDRTQWLEWVVDELARNRLKVSVRRNARVGDESGFAYGWWIWLGAPGSETWFAVGLAPWRESESGSPFWIQVNSSTDEWETVEVRLRGSSLSEVIQVEQGDDDGVTRIWIPLDATPELGWNELLQRLVDQAIPIREVIAGGSDGT